MFGHTRDNREEQIHPEDRDRRLKAAREIAKMELPVAGWQQMEEEIVKGASANLGRREAH